MSKYTADYLKQKLIQELDARHVEVVDESDGCGGKFSCIVVSDVFQNKSLIQKHRLVQKALAEELKEIHAFSQKTYTIEDWEKAQKEQQKQ